MRQRPKHLLRNDQDRERPVDPHFEKSERLYRRFMPDHWDGENLDIAAIQLPDISVNRGKYCESSTDVIWSEDRRFDEWGVCSFIVGDVPCIYHQAYTYSSDVVHKPERLNYPHSEVQAFENGLHVTRNLMESVSPEAHLRFREHLLRKTRIDVHPGEARWPDS